MKHFSPAYSYPRFTAGVDPKEWIPSSDIASNSIQFLEVFAVFENGHFQWSKFDSRRLTVCLV